MVKAAENNNRLTLGELYFFFSYKRGVFQCDTPKAVYGVCKGLKTYADLDALGKDL